MSNESARYAKDLRDLPADHPYALVRSLVRPGQVVLDVGCGSGEVGELLVEAGVTVDGIEADPGRAAVARARLRTVAIGFVEPGFAPVDLAGAYDAILLFDVIEHVAAPASILAWCRPRLAPHGSIYCLIPNSAHWRFRKKILSGDWSYDEAGLFDRDHLRFYDTRSMGGLPAKNGLVESRRWYFPARGRRQRLKRLLMRQWPNLVSYYVLLEWRPTPITPD